MSQVEFAEKLGSSRTAVSSWENEIYKPGEDMINKLLILASKYDYEHANRN